MLLYEKYELNIDYNQREKYENYEKIKEERFGRKKNKKSSFV